MTQINSKVKRRSGKNCQAMFSCPRSPSDVGRKILGGSTGCSASQRNIRKRTCKRLKSTGSLGNRGSEIRPHSRAENIWKIKAKRTHTHPKKSKTNKNDPNAGTARPRWKTKPTRPNIYPYSLPVYQRSRLNKLNIPMRAYFPANYQVKRRKILFSKGQRSPFIVYH